MNSSRLFLEYITIIFKETQLILIDSFSYLHESYSDFCARIHVDGKVQALPLLVNKTKRCTEFQFYWYYNSTCFGQPFCPSSGVLSHTSALVHFMQLWWPFATIGLMWPLGLEFNDVTKWPLYHLVNYGHFKLVTIDLRNSSSVTIPDSGNWSLQLSGAYTCALLQHSVEIKPFFPVLWHSKWVQTHV